MQEARAAPFGAASATAGAWSSEQAHGAGDVRAHAFGTASVLGPEGSGGDTPGPAGCASCHALRTTYPATHARAEQRSRVQPGAALSVAGSCAVVRIAERASLRRTAERRHCVWSALGRRRRVSLAPSAAGMACVTPA